MIYEQGTHDCQVWEMKIEKWRLRLNQYEFRFKYTEFNMSNQKLCQIDRLFVNTVTAF